MAEESTELANLLWLECNSTTTQQEAAWIEHLPQHCLHLGCA
jgi:hypothetical protein